MDNTNPDSTTQSNPAPPAAQETSPSAAVDINKLAERVYRLLLADLRLERARGEHLVQRGRK